MGANTDLNNTIRKCDDDKFEQRKGDAPINLWIKSIEGQQLDLHSAHDDVREKCKKSQFQNTGEFVELSNRWYRSELTGGHLLNFRLTSRIRHWDCHVLISISPFSTIAKGGGSIQRSLWCKNNKRLVILERPQSRNKKEARLQSESYFSLKLNQHHHLQESR